jgi:predicted naringenin-chalcone synthase
MLIDIATAPPPYKVTRSKAAEELKKRMKITPGQSRLIDTAANYSGIDTRYIVVPDAEETAAELFYTNSNEALPTTKTRMEEYEKWSKRLGCNAVGQLLNDNKIDPGKINKLITISCTGFYAPGLDYYIMKEFNIPFTAKRINIGFMGCAASLIGFNSILETYGISGSSSYTGHLPETHDEINTLLISVELCSLHLLVF